MDVRLPDGRIITNVPEGITQSELVARLRRNGLPIPEGYAPQERTTGEAFKDLGASALQGVGSIVALPGQIYGAVTGNVDNAVSKAGAGIRDYGESLKSEELKFKQEQLRAQAAEAAKNGVLDEFLTTLKGTATDPALLAALLAEFAPNLIPGAAIARGAGAVGKGAALARGLTQEAAEKAGTRIGTGAAIGAGATLEGGGSFEETYKEAMDLLAQQGVTGPQAEEIALSQARKAGAATTAATAAVGAIPGFRGLESILAGGGAKGAIRTGVGEFAQGVAEGATTTVPGNVALQSIDPTIELLRGTGSAAATEALGGGVAGTTFGAFGEDTRKPAVDPAVTPTPESDRREQFRLMKEQEQKDKLAREQLRVAEEGEKLLAREQKELQKQERDRQKALSLLDKEQTNAARQARYQDLVDAFGDDFSGYTNVSALLRERAALESLPESSETKKILSNINRRIKELNKQDIQAAKNPPKVPPTQEEIDAQKAEQSAFGGAAPAQGELFPMDREALGNEPPAVDAEPEQSATGPRIITRNQLLQMGLGQGATIAKGVNPLVAAQAKSAGIRAQQPYENSLVGLDLSKPEDVREAQRILDRVDQNPLIADDTKASLRQMVLAQPELNQRRLNFEGETTETILAKQENFNKALRDREQKKTEKVGGAAGTGDASLEGVPEPTRKAGKTTGFQFFGEQRKQPSAFSKDTGLPADNKVTFADIAAALDDDLKANAGRANQWFSESNRKKLEELFVGKTPAEIKAMTIKAKPGSLMDAVYTELTKQAPAPVTEPTALQGESDAEVETSTGNDVDAPATGERAQAEPEPNATDVQSDSDGRGTTGRVAEQPTGAGVGAGVRDSKPADGGKAVQSGSLGFTTPDAAPKAVKPSRVSKKSKSGLPVTPETKAVTAELRQRRELKKIVKALEKKEVNKAPEPIEEAAPEEAPAVEAKPFEPLPADQQVKLRPQDFKKKSDEENIYQYIGPRGEVYEYMPATGTGKGFVVRGPGMKPAFVRNQATARTLVEKTLNGVKEEPGKMPEKSTTPKTFNGPVAVVTDDKVKAEIEAKAAAEAERKAAQEAKRAEEKAAEAAAKADPVRELEFEAEKDLFREQLQKLASEDETPIKPVVDASRDAESRGFILPEEGARIRRTALANKNPSMALEDLMQRVKTAKFDPDFEVSPTYKKPLYAKRVGVVEGVDPERVQEIVDEAAAESDNTPTVVVVRRQSDIPMTLLRKHFDDVAQAKGFVDLETNTVYLLPDNIASDKDIWLTYTHEVVGHYGLRAVLGEDYSAVMKAAAQNETVIAELGKDAPTERNVEEAIARIAELSVDDKLPKPVLPLFTRIETAVKNFLRSLGLDIALTDRELYGLLADARTYVQSGKRKGKGVAGQPSEKSIALRSGSTNGITQADIDRMEEAAGSVRAVRREEASVAQDFVAVAKAVLQAPMKSGSAFRTAVFDRSATLADKISRLYGTGLRDALGKVNPLGLLRQAEGVSRIMDAVFKKGGIAYQADKNLYAAVEVTVQKPTSSLPVGTPASISGLFDVIKEFAKARGLDLDTAEGYLHRAMEGRRLKYMVEENARVEAEASKMKGAAAQKYLDDNLLVLPTNVDLDAFIAESEAAFEKEDYLRQYDDIMRAVREHAIERAVEAGVLSREQGDEWTAALEYVPFTRMSEEFDKKSVNMVARGLTAFSKIRKLVGSETKPIGNITDNFANNIGWMTSQTLRNMAAQQVLTELETFNYAREMKGPRDFLDENAVVSVLRDGKEQYYELADPMDVNAFASLPMVTGPITRIMQASTRFLRASVTLMPQFAVSQVIQDSIRAGFNSGAKRPFEAMARTLVNFPVVLLIESLGPNHPMVRNFKFMQKKAEAMEGLKDVGTVGQYDLNVLNPAANIRYDSGVARRNGWQKVIKAADTFTSASDMAARLAVYEQIQKEFPNDFVRPQVAARELINFNRRGSSSIVAFMINAVPFFNAYLQSMDLMYRNLKGVDTASGLTKNAMRAQMVKTGGMLFGLSLAYAFMMSDDEEYKNTPDVVKDRNLILPGAVALPIPPELGAIFKTTAERLVQYVVRKGTPEEQAAGEAIGNTFKSLWNAYSSPNPTPQVFKPILEAWTNYSFFTGRPIVPQSMQGLEPFRQIGAETSEFARLVGEQFNVSPLMVDQVLSSTFGMAGATVIQLTDAALSDRGDRPLYRYPFLSTFMKNPQGGQIVNEFYDLNEKAQRVKRTFDSLVEEDQAAATAYIEKGNNAQLYVTAGYLSDKLQVIADLREYRRYVESDKGLTGEEKRRELDAIAGYRIQLLGDVRELKRTLNEGGGL